MNDASGSESEVSSEIVTGPTEESFWNPCLNSTGSIGDMEELKRRIYNEDIGRAPYMALVQVKFINSVQNCAGTLVTEMHVLTLAKCVYDGFEMIWAETNMVTVIFGTT